LPVALSPGQAPGAASERLKFVELSPDVGVMVAAPLLVAAAQAGYEDAATVVQTETASITIE